MAEKHIPLGELYDLCPGKPKGVCPVRFCRKSSRDHGRLCHMHNLRAWRTRNPMKAAFTTLRDHALGKKREFSLSFEDFKILCIETGYVEGKGQSPENLSIDRIDFRHGYIPGNIRVTTVTINSRKGNHEKFIKTSAGLVQWEEIDIAEFIEAEKTRADKYDPRNKFKSIPVPFDDDDEERLEKAFGLASSNQESDPF